MSNPVVSSPDQIRRLPRLRFTWGAKSDVRGEWRLGLFGYHIKGYPRELWILISVRGLLIWTVSLALAGYLAAAASLTWWLGRNPYNRVGFTDLVLPSHWPAMRQKRASGFIDEGLHEVRSGNLGVGLLLLQRGLAGKPDDLRARMVVGQIFARAGQVHRALQILRVGLPYHGGTRSYLEVMFRLTDYLEDQRAALEILDESLQRFPNPAPALERWLAGQRVRIWEKLHRGDDILALRESRGTPLIALDQAWARTLAERGRAAEALRFVQANPERLGLPAERWELEYKLALAAGRPAVARAAMQTWVKLDPNNVLPRVEEILQLAKDGSIAELRAALERYFLNFSAEPKAPVLLLQRLTELINLTPAELAWQEVRKSGLTAIDLRVLRVQGLMLSGRLAEAQPEYAATREFIKAKKIRDAGWAEATGLLLDLLAHDSPSARAQFFDLCARQQLQPQAYRFVLRCLRNQKLDDIAGELVAVVRNRYPTFEDTGAPAEPAVKLVVAAPGAAKEAPVTGVAEARVELRKLDQEIQAGHWQAVAVMLQRMDALTDGELREPLLLRRVQLHGNTREQAELTADLHLYLALKNVNLSALREFATQWRSGPRKESALTLAREVAGRFPQARWAADLRDELQGALRIAPVELETTNIARPQ